MAETGLVGLVVNICIFLIGSVKALYRIRIGSERLRSRNNSGTGG